MSTVSKGRGSLENEKVHTIRVDHDVQGSSLRASLRGKKNRHTPMPLLEISGAGLSVPPRG